MEDNFIVVYLNFESDYVTLNQSKVIKKFANNNCSNNWCTVGCLLEPSVEYSYNIENMATDDFTYRELVGNLICLSTKTRSDLTFVSSALANTINML